MNLAQKHDPLKPISVSSFFKGIEGTVTSLQILKEQQLKEHVTKVPACLVCISGKVVFENEKGIEEELSTGEYIEIEAMVKHWVNAKEDSQLLLLK